MKDNFILGRRLVLLPFFEGFLQDKISPPLICRIDYVGCLHSGVWLPPVADPLYHVSVEMTELFGNSFHLKALLNF